MNCSSEISGTGQEDTDFFQVLSPHRHNQVLKTLKHLFSQMCVPFLCPFYWFFSFNYSEATLDY